MSSLRDIRAAVSGDALDAGCAAMRARLDPAVLPKVESHASKLRAVARSLIQIGANLSQSRGEKPPLHECCVSLVLTAGWCWRGIAAYQY